MTSAVRGRSDRLPEFGTYQSSPGRSRFWLTGPVGCEDAVAERVTHAVEETAAAMDVPPTFLMRALRVAARIQKIRPRLVINRTRIARARDMRLAAVAELVLWPRAAPGASDQQHQCATAAAAASSIRRPVLNRSSENGAAIGCGSLRAIVAANTWPDPGVALNPPVPQPQLTNRPGTGVSPMIGERSGVTSTMPPQLRSMRRRRNVGKSSQMASSVCAEMCSPPAWLYDT